MTIDPDSLLEGLLSQYAFITLTEKLGRVLDLLIKSSKPCLNCHPLLVFLQMPSLATPSTLIGYQAACLTLASSPRVLAHWVLPHVTSACSLDSVWISKRSPTMALIPTTFTPFVASTFCISFWAMSMIVPKVLPLKVATAFPRLRVIPFSRFAGAWAEI